MFKTWHRNSYLNLNYDYINWILFLFQNEDNSEKASSPEPISKFIIANIFLTNYRYKYKYTSNLNIIVDYQDPVKYVVEDIKVDKKIVDLASIILKIEQSIEPKFLKRPLGNL